MKTELSEKAEYLLQCAVDAGAEQAQVWAYRSQTQKVSYLKNEFSISMANTGQSLTLKIHKDKRRGSASTNETQQNTLKETAERALALARFALEDEYLALPEPQEYPELPGRFDPALAEMSSEQLHNFTASFVAAARTDPRISIDAGQVDVSSTHALTLNTEGLHAADQYTRLGWSIMGMAKTEKEVTSLNWLGGNSFCWDGTAAQAELSARSLTKLLIACFGAKKGESYRGPVLFTPDVLAKMLIVPLQYQIGGQQIMDGKSRWDKSLGQRVAKTEFSLIDNPFNLQLSGASPYDAEGVTTRRTPIIEQGILKTHIDSTYTARRRGTESTGHCGGLHGVEISAGRQSYDDLLSQPEKVLVLERFSGNVDPVTGDFSGVAKGSHYYRAGQYQHPLVETMVAGNFFDMLNSIIGIGSEAKPWCNNYLAPAILVDGISVTAA